MYIVKIKFENTVHYVGCFATEQMASDWIKQHSQNEKNCEIVYMYPKMSYTLM